MPGFTTATQTPGSVLAARFGGEVTTGGTLPTTVIFWFALLVLPEASVAIHWIVVTPIENVAESGRLSLRDVDIVTFGQLSAAVASPTTTVAVEAPTSVRAEIFEGAVTDGLSPSVTVTV